MINFVVLREGKNLIVKVNCDSDITADKLSKLINQLLVRFSSRLPVKH